MSGGDLLNIGGDLAGAYFGSQAAGDAADQQMAALREAQGISQEAVKQGRSDILATGEPGLEDLITGFQGAINVLETPGQAETQAAALSGAQGPEAQQAAIDAMIQGPGQQYLRDQQEQALLRNASAIGGLGGGRVRSALQEQAFGRAATQQQQHLQNLVQASLPEQNRASNISNILSSGGRQLAQFRSGLGTNLSNISTGGAAQQIPLIEGTGIARAAGTLGANTALQTGIGGATKTLGQLL